MTEGLVTALFKGEDVRFLPESLPPFEDWGRKA